MTPDEIQAARAKAECALEACPPRSLALVLAAKLTRALDALEASRRECEELRAEGGFSVTLSVFDHWARDRSDNGHRPYRNLIYDAAGEEQICQFRAGTLEDLLRAAGVQSGDEFELTIRRTGRRPKGERRHFLHKPHEYRLETPEECAERLATDAEERERRRRIIEG